MKQWQVQEAKARFSTVIKEAQEHGPQNITVRGKPTAVIISMAEFKKMKETKPSFVQFMRNSPLVGTKIYLKRDDSTCRDVEL